MSRHLSTPNISSKSMHAFLSNFAHRQTDRQTDRQTNAFTSSFVGGKNTYHELSVYKVECRFKLAAQHNADVTFVTYVHCGSKYM